MNPTKVRSSPADTPKGGRSINDRPTVVPANAGLGLALAEGETLRLTEADGDLDGLVLALGLTLADGLTLAEEDAEGDCDALGLTDADADALGDVLAEGDWDAEEDALGLCDADGLTLAETDAEGDLDALAMARSLVRPRTNETSSCSGGGSGRSQSDWPKVCAMPA